MFYYVRENKNIKEHNYYNQLSFYDYVTKDKFNHATNNLQTYWVSGTDKNDLKTAKKNLKEHFSVVGITERFKETLLVLKNEIKINWDIGEYKNANITKNKPSINQLSPEILDIITKKNQNDIKLYKFANKLLDEKLKKLDK
jgi:hypothetical protein